MIPYLKSLQFQEEDQPPARFTLSDSDLIRKAKAKVRRLDDRLEQILEFEDREYADAVIKTMQCHYWSVLLDLLPILKLIVERHKEWEIRVRAAQALAEVGKIGFQRVRSQVLEPWAADKRSYVRASVGYPLARLAEDETARATVKDILADWTRKDPTGLGEAWQLSWTAASTYKQIGLIDADWSKQWACDGLKKIAGFNDIRLGDAVIHSLVVLSLKGQLEPILKSLDEWIKEGVGGGRSDLSPQIRCLVGLLAFMVLGEVHNELVTEDQEVVTKEGLVVRNLFEMICQSETTRGDTWQLVVAVGVRAFEYRLSYPFLNLVERWAKYSGTNIAQQNTVANLLADIYFRVKRLPAHKEHIRNRIRQWQRQTKDDGLRRTGAIAMARLR